MKMKKFMAVLLALAVTAGMTACSGEGIQKAGETADTAENSDSSESETAESGATQIVVGQSMGATSGMERWFCTQYIILW